MTVPMIAKLSHPAGISMGRRVCLLVSAVVCSGSSFLLAQDDKQVEAARGTRIDGFKSGIQLIPQTAAGILRIPSLPQFCASGKGTHLGQLLDNPAMQPFIEAQREQAKNHLAASDTRLGLRPQDLYDIASGEVVAAWLPFEKDQRRPFSLVVVTDVRGRQQQVTKAIDKIDHDLVAGKATRTEVKHRNQTVRVYTTKPKPGQIKIEQVAIFYDEDRLIASDRDTVIFDLLDAIAGEPKDKPIGTVSEFQTVMKKSREAFEKHSEQEAIEALQWFARPFPMGRIIRKSLNIDRGTQVDILKLLENQGFDAVRGAGGIVMMAGEKFDFLHRGYILAPATDKPPKRYAGAAEMLTLDEAPLADIPVWILSESASCARLNWNLERAFWAAEPLVNEALGQPGIFREIIDGIRDDEEGTQIDIVKDVLPYLDNQLIIATDNTIPVSTDSDRLMVAVRIKNAVPIRKAIHKAMEVEPDAKLLTEVPNVEIWRVERNPGKADFNPEDFNDLGFEEVKDDSSPPILNHMAIAVVEKGPTSGSPYILFSSHSDLLISVAKRIQQGAEPGMAADPIVNEVLAAARSLGANSVAIDRVVRTDLSLRAKYELLRQGKLKDSDSVLATLMRRIFEKADANQEQGLDASLLPPIDRIEAHLRPAGSYIEVTEDGMTLNGFLLK